MTHARTRPATPLPCPLPSASTRTSTGRERTRATRLLTAGRSLRAPFMYPMAWLPRQGVRWGVDDPLPPAYVRLTHAAPTRAATLDRVRHRTSRHSCDPPTGQGAGTCADAVWRSHHPGCARGRKVTGRHAPSRNGAHIATARYNVGSGQAVRHCVSSVTFLSGAESIPAQGLRSHGRGWDPPCV